MSYPTRQLGDEQVSALGLGLMGMTQSYVSFGGFNDEESFRTLDTAHEMGIRFWDTADMYGPESNERLVVRDILT
jgi:aryl-alcohol dehydrogenase-like predicted oxidoreductase